MTSSTYHSDRERVTNSSLAHFARAPILWKKWRDGLLPDKKTADMIFGSLVHCLQFEPENLTRLFACLPDDAPNKLTKPQLAAWQRFGSLPKPTKAQIAAYDRNTESLRWWNEWAEVNEGKDAIDGGDIAEANACLAGLQSDPKCREFLALPGLSEVVVEWVDEATGIPCKLKLDRFFGMGILDLKTCADASEKAFKSAAIDKRYHNQCAFYLKGVRSAFNQGTLPTAIAAMIQNIDSLLFIFTAVEKDDNHLAHCMPADADFIQRGMDENALLMRDLAHCLKTDNWPGLSRNPSGMTPLSLPGWLPELPPLET